MADRDRDTGPVVGKDRDETEGDDHLDELPDGAGCAEIWEYLSELRVTDDD